MWLWKESITSIAFCFSFTNLTNWYSSTTNTITQTHTSVEVQLGHLQSVGLALFLAEAENDDGLKVPLHDHLHYLKHTGWTCGSYARHHTLRCVWYKWSEWSPSGSKQKQTFSASFTSSWVPLASSAAPRISCISQYLHGSVKIVLPKVSLRGKTFFSTVHYYIHG